MLCPICRLSLLLDSFILVLGWNGGFWESKRFFAADGGEVGITKPISLAGPTKADLQRNMELEKVKIFSDFFSFCWLG
jgi:hypothetical protein